MPASTYLCTPAGGTRQLSGQTSFKTLNCFCFSDLLPTGFHGTELNHLRSCDNAVTFLATALSQSVTSENGIVSRIGTTIVRRSVALSGEGITLRSFRLRTLVIIGHSFAIAARTPLPHHHP